MISVNDDVKLKGAVTETGTGTFKIAISEFYLDGEWRKFAEPKEVEVGAEDYTNELTSMELYYIKQKAIKDAQSTSLDHGELEVVKSIAKKLSAASCPNKE